MKKESPFKIAYPAFKDTHIEAISRVLGDTGSGLTGSEIEKLLAAARIPDIDPMNTKWKRLHNAFASFQNEYQVGNHIIIFITKALDPSLYLKKEPFFENLLLEINKVLSFCGYVVGRDGKVRVLTTRVTTLDEAKAKAAHLKTKLEQRSAHSNVFKFCDAELLQNNYFHAVFEAVKSVSYRIREISGLDGDGHILVENAFGASKGTLPRVRINAYDSETKKGEQFGFINLLKGLYGTFRNPLGHEAKIEWDMTEEDALDVLSLVSLIHRKLDKSLKS